MTPTTLCHCSVSCDPLVGILINNPSCVPGLLCVSASGGNVVREAKKYNDSVSYIRRILRTSLYIMTVLTVLASA